MSLSHLILILRARWKLAFLIWFCTVALVASASIALLLLAPKYTSSATVVVDNKSADPISGVVMAGGLIPSYMATQVDVAQSDRVILRAIKATRLADSTQTRESWMESTGGRGSFEAWLAAQLLKRYTVSPSRESNAMSLSFTDTDPAFSAAMTNALMQAYIDTTLELRVEPAKQYNTFFDERSRQLRESLEVAQNKLSSYQRANGLLAADERFDVENSRLAELSTQLVVLQNVAAEATGRETEAGVNPSRMTEVLTNPLVATLSTDLSRMQTRMEELRARYGSQHPQVIELASSIKETESRLNQAVRSATGSVAVASNVSKSRLDQARQALEQQRAKVVELKSKRDEAAVLQRDVENAQRAYDTILARVSQSDLESQNRQTNVSVLQQATEPPFPSSPKVVLNTAVAFVVGLLLAIGSVIAREMSDRRMRTHQDVVLSLNQPLLIVLPNSGAKDRSRLSQKKARLISGLPRPTIS